MGNTDEVVRVSDAFRTRELERALRRTIGLNANMYPVDVQTGSDGSCLVSMTMAQFDAIFDRDRR